MLASFSPASPSEVVTLELVLEYSGEDQVEGVRELILRDLKLSDITPECLPRLSQLEILSLSHNAFKSFNFSTSLENLIEVMPLFYFAAFLCSAAYFVQLNLNFNQISDMSYIEVSCQPISVLHHLFCIVAQVEEAISFKQ